MVGVLLLAHGSRAKETEITLEAMAGMIREIMPDKPLQTACMEFGEIDIESGLNKLVEAGVMDIKVIPYFLFEGIHIREDIPGEIEKYRQKHKGINISMGKTLGADKRIAEIVRDRIEETLA